MNAFIKYNALNVIINHETLPFIMVMSSLDKYNSEPEVIVSDGSGQIEEGVRYAAYNLDSFYIDARDIYMAMYKLRRLPVWDRETKTFKPTEEEGFWRA